MKGLFIVLISAVLLLPSCRKHSSATQGDAFIFGKACGFCTGDCASYYKIQNGQLYKNESAQRPVQDLSTLEFSKVLSSNQYNIVKDLQSHIPQQLYSYPDSIFGCPDCSDQCGYSILVQQGNAIYNWRLDPFLANDSNSFLKLFVDELGRDISQLQ